MAIKLKVDLRVRIMGALIKDRELLRLSITWVDDEVRDHLRRSMIKWIDSMYMVDDVRHVTSKFNDLVEGIDYVDETELARLFPAGLPKRDVSGWEIDFGRGEE